MNKLLNYEYLKNWWILPAVLLIAVVCSNSIVSWPFPQNLAIILGLPLLIVIWWNMQAGIVIWFVLSSVGNMFEVDLPGIPPLRTAHMILLMLLGVWIIQSYKDIPAAIVRFFSTGKNRLLLLLLGWITFSIVMGRLTGVTQKSFEYQFNAWMSVVLAIALAMLVSSSLDERLLKSIILTSVVLGTILTGVILARGLSSGLDLIKWKAYYYEFLRTTNIVIISPFFLAILYFRDQRWWGRFLFAVAILLSIILNVLLIFSGSRSHLFFLITLAFLFFLTRPRLLTLFTLLLVVPVVVLNAGALKSMIEEQASFTITSQGVAVGRGTRIALAQDAFHIIQKYPVWGTGSDFYRYYSNLRVIHPSGLAELIPSAHNTWLQTAVDYGIPAAVLLVLFVGYILKDIFNLYRFLDDRVLKKYTLLFLAEFCTAIIGSPFGEAVLPVFTGTDGGEAARLADFLLDFWLSYGIILGIENWQKKQKKAMVNSSADSE